jgi:hypothetical protein
MLAAFLSTLWKPSCFPLLLTSGLWIPQKIVANRISGRSKGFGFVEMPYGQSALKVIAALNGTEVCGSSIMVNQAESNADPKRLCSEN